MYIENYLDHVVLSSRAIFESASDHRFIFEFSEKIFYDFLADASKKEKDIVYVIAYDKGNEPFTIGIGSFKYINWIKPNLIFPKNKNKCYIWGSSRNEYSGLSVLADFHYYCLHKNLYKVVSKLVKTQKPLSIKDRIKYWW